MKDFQPTESEIDAAMERLVKMTVVALKAKGSTLDERPIHLERQNEKIVISIGGQPLTAVGIEAVLGRHK